MTKFFFAFIVVLTSIKTFSQVSGLNDVQLKMENHFKSYPSEKLYVHTDKSFYTAGEIIWFKIYKVSDSLGNDIASGKVVYVDVLDDNHTSVLKAKVPIDEKGGDGSIELPLTLNSGYYTLRAYTNWMKNFGPECFFEKRITIVNPFKTIPAPAKTELTGSIDLFPEGGNLVNGILSQVGFKINSSKTSGKGFVVNENNDTVSRFAPYKFGLGSFYFTPELNRSYKAVFIFDDNSFVTKPMPQIFSEGYVMHADEDQRNINVTVRTNVSSASEIFLIAQNHQKIRTAKRNKLSDGVTIFSINKSELGPGVSEFTVFDQDRQPVCERLFFIRPSQQTNLIANPSKQVYRNRELVSLPISSASPDPTDVSVSVFQFDTLQMNDEHDIASYIWLESELTGRIENPHYYLYNTSDEAKKAADHLMLTHGWRRFDWSRIFNKSFKSRFDPESSGQIIGCKVVDSLTGAPVKDVNVFLSIPESSYKLFSGLSNDSGMVQFRTNEFYGNGEIILQTIGSKKSYKLELISPFSEQYNPELSQPFAISARLKTLLENFSISMQSQHIYATDSIQKFLLPVLRDSFPFYGQPQNSYLLDNYVRFTTMEEVLREYVREINVGVKGGELKFKLLNENNRDYFTYNILVTMDGVPVSDPNTVFKLDPLKIRRIDIIPRSYVLGTSIFYGLANFYTYKENHEGIDIDPKAIVLDYEGLQLKRKFYSPDYSNEERFKDRRADLRNTLYWSPSIRDNQQVQFYTSDNKGKYIVVVQGLSNKGEPLSSVSEFEVK
jgi:hypothetical protein